MDTYHCYMFHVWDVGNEIGHRCVVCIVERYVERDMYQTKYLRNAIELHLFELNVRECSIERNLQSTYLNPNFYCTNEKLLTEGRINGLLLHELQLYELFVFQVRTYRFYCAKM